MITNKELIAAIKEVLHIEQKPLELWRIAHATNSTTEAVSAQLIDCLKTEKIMIDFRYPALPCGAIIKITDY